MEIILELCDGDRNGYVQHQIGALATPDSVKREILPLMLDEAIRQISPTQIRPAVPLGSDGTDGQSASQDNFVKGA